MDWNLLIPPHDLDNISNLNALLADELDVPLIPPGSCGEDFVQTYQTRWGILQFHLGGPGFPRFDVLESRAVQRLLSGTVYAKCVCGEDLLQSKLASHRPADADDIDFLETKKAAGLL